jgi:hypothetical protein
MYSLAETSQEFSSLEITEDESEANYIVVKEQLLRRWEGITEGKIYELKRGFDGQIFVVDDLGKDYYGLMLCRMDLYRSKE